MLFSLPRVSAAWGHRLILLTLLVFLVGVLWWPNGLNIPPTEDDWNNYVLFDQAALNPTFTLPAINPYRPIITLWWQLAYATSPDSMLAVNWFLFLALVIRTVSFYVIVLFLVRHRGWAAAAACLMIVLPLDSGVYDKGTFHIHIATSLYFMATAFFLTHVRRLTLMSFLFVSVLIVLACGTYESVYPLMAATPLLLVLRERQITRRILFLSLAWWGVLAGCAMLIFIPSITAETSYQRNLMSPVITLSSVLRTTVDAYIHVFAKSWYAAIRKEPGDFLFLRLLVGMGVAAGVWMMTRRSPAPRLPLWLVLLTGIFLTGAGFAMYLPTSLLSGGGGTRVHYLTAAGASLVIVALSWFAARILRFPVIFPLIVGGLITLSLGGMMNTTRAGTLAQAYGQGQLLSFLTAHAPHIESDTTLVFLFSPDVNNPFPDFYVAYLNNAVTYLYRDYSLKVVVCYESNCSQEDWSKLDAARTVVFRVAPNFDLELITTVPDLGTTYAPQERIDMSAPRPHRWSTLYTQLGD